MMEKTSCHRVGVYGFPLAPKEDFYIFYLSWRADNLAKDGGCADFDYDLAPFLNTTDLKALLEDTDSMARGAALAAEMGNTDPLKIIAVPHVH